MEERMQSVPISVVFEDESKAIGLARVHPGAVVAALPGLPPRWVVTYQVPADLLSDGFLGGDPPGD